MRLSPILIGMTCAVAMAAQDTALIQSGATPSKKQAAYLPPAELLFGEAIRMPYQANRIYKLRIAPGSPVAIVLPEGETFKNMYCDKYYFLAESTPGSNLGIIRAIPAAGVVGKSTNLICETQPLGLNINFVVEVVDRLESGSMAPCWTFYLEGQDPVIAARRAALQEVQAQYAEGREMQAREVESRLISSLGRLRTTYKFPKEIKKVVDDGVRTFIYVPDSQEQGALKVETKNGDEVPTFKFDNGVYQVFRTLRDGERFVLEVGKTKYTIKLD